MPDWVLIRARVGQEDAAARALMRFGYRVYFPRQRRFIWPSGRRNACHPVMVPRFPGYLFAHDWRGWPNETFTSAIVGLARFGAGVAALSHADLVLIREAEWSGEFDEPDPRSKPQRSDLAVGQAVIFERFDHRIEARIERLSPNGQAVLREIQGGARLNTNTTDLQVVAY